jgi:hypothetical protein
MAIEFRCPQCQKLLRVGDDAAGKQAKCPGCGTPVTVPMATAPPSPPPVPGGVPPIGGGGADPFGGIPLPPVGDNPYAAPFSTNIPTTGMRGGAGPAWERDGASLSSLIATVKEAFTSPSEFFSSMRQEGGFGAPLLFFFILFMAATIVSSIVNFGIQLAMAGAMPQQPGFGGGAPWAAVAGGGVIGLVFGLVFSAIFIPIYAFVLSGIFHVALMIFGGANRPFETSFRVVCYAGATAAIGLIPVCGGSVQGIVFLVFIGIGLCYAHNTNGWRATLAVITPGVCCFGGMIALVIAIVGGVAAAGGAAGGAAPPPGFQPQPFDPNAIQVDDFQVDEFQIEERWRLSPEAIAPRGFNPLTHLLER